MGLRGFLERCRKLGGIEQKKCEDSCSRTHSGLTASVRRNGETIPRILLQRLLRWKVLCCVAATNSAEWRLNHRLKLPNQTGF